MESAKECGKIRIICQDTALYTEISVHDSGRGFKEKELLKIFDRYYRGEDSHTVGFGIGLALSRSIVIRQGGTIDAKNHPEGGAVFIIRFPK